MNDGGPGVRKVIEHPSARAARLEGERDELADALASLVDALDVEGVQVAPRERSQAARVLERWGHRRG